MGNWHTEDKKTYIFLEDFPKDAVAFVYIITNKKTNQYYVGKKTLHLNRKKKITKKELLEYEGKRGRKPKSIQVVVESDWKTYYGSNEQLKEDVKTLGFDNFDRKILRICKSKREATYYEVKYQFAYNCLEDSQSYNTSILGTFYKKNIG